MTPLPRPIRTSVGPTARYLERVRTVVVRREGAVSSARWVSPPPRHRWGLPNDRDHYCIVTAAISQDAHRESPPTGGTCGAGGPTGCRGMTHGTRGAAVTAPFLICPSLPVGGEPSTRPRVRGSRPGQPPSCLPNGCPILRCAWSHAVGAREDRQRAGGRPEGVARSRLTRPDGGLCSWRAYLPRSMILVRGTRSGPRFTHLTDFHELSQQCVRG